MAKDRVDGRGSRSGAVKASKQKRSRSTLWLGITIVVLIGAGVAFSLMQPKAGTPAASGFDPSIPPVHSEGYVVGSDSAPVHVVEIADFECPACMQYSTVTEPDVRSRLIQTGEMQLRFIDFPLPVHRNTWNASRAAACANEQGKFWEYHDLLFQTQDRWNGEATNNPDPVLKDLAKTLGLNTDQFNQCVDSKKYQAKVQAHYTIGEKNANVTPTFFFNGKKVEGALPYDQFKAEVDAAKSRPILPLEGGILPDTTAPAAGGKTGDSATLTPAARGASSGAPAAKKP